MKKRYAQSLHDNTTNHTLLPENTLGATNAWAAQAGRLMIEEGFIDYRLAKQKAAKQLGGNTSGKQPSNQEVEAAALAYYQLYRGETEINWHLDQLYFGLDTLKALAHFDPKLSGTLTLGRPNALDEIEVHIDHVSPEQVLNELLDVTPNVLIEDKQVRLSGNQAMFTVPVYKVDLGEFVAKVMVFEEGLGQIVPLAVHNNKPSIRWSKTDVQAQIDALSAVLTSAQHL